jgi:hypothetical protein
MTERASLPDLDQLNSEDLKTLIAAQHQQLLSKDEELASRDSEIEQLKLLIAKLQRMQFGRKSEKLGRQIEQLQLRLEALEMNNAEQVAALPKPPENVERLARPARQQLPAHLPREVQTYVPKEEACPDCGGALHKLGEDISEILERVPARCYVIRPGAGEVGLWKLRQNRASESAEPAHRTRYGGAGAVGPCTGLEVCGSSSLVPAGRDFRARRSGTGAGDFDGLGGGNQPTDGAAG